MSQTSSEQSPTLLRWCGRGPATRRGDDPGRGVLTTHPLFFPCPISKGAVEHLIPVDNL